MILHEYYFSNLRAAPSRSRPGSAVPPRSRFGSVELAGLPGDRRRGVGWVILFEDPVRRLTNHWVTLHQEGIPPASSRCSSWTCGSTRSCATTRRPSGEITWRRSSGTSTGMSWSAGSSSHGDPSRRGGLETGGSSRATLPARSAVSERGGPVVADQPSLEVQDREARPGRTRGRRARPSPAAPRSAPLRPRSSG